MENQKIYDEIFMDVFSVDASMLNEEFSKENIPNWNSIVHLNLITSIEDVFDIMFGADEVLALTSYKMGKKILSDKYGITF